MVICGFNVPLFVGSIMVISISIWSLYKSLQNGVSGG